MNRLFLLFLIINNLALIGANKTVSDIIDTFPRSNRDSERMILFGHKPNAALRSHANAHIPIKKGKKQFPKSEYERVEDLKALNDAPLHAWDEKQLFAFGLELVRRYNKKIEKDNLKKKDFHFLQKLPFKTSKDNAEIAILAELIFKHKVIDRDFDKFFRLRNLSLETPFGTKKDNHVTIVGGGPLGLIAAIAALRNGKQVTLIEKRKSYSRETIVALNKDFFSWFRSIMPNCEVYLRALGILNTRPGWKDLGKIPGSGFGSIRTQQLEHMLSMFLQRFQQLSEDKKALTIIRGAEVKDINAVENGYQVKYKVKGSVKTVRSRVVIGADGAKGKSKELVGLKMEAQSNIHWAGYGLFEATADDAFLFSMKFANTSLRSHIYTNKDKKRILKRLQALGWKKQRLPAIRTLQNGKIFYVASETPSKTSLNFAGNDRKSEEFRQLWFKAIKDLAYPEFTTVKLKPLSSGPATSIFPSGLRALKKSFVINKRGKRRSGFIAVGDNAAQFHFMTRLGINVGFSQLESIDAFIYDHETPDFWNLKSLERSFDIEVKAAQLVTLNRTTFSDGPFMRSLSKRERAIQTFIRKHLKINDIDYKTMILPLKNSSFDPTNQEHIDKAKRLLKKGKANECFSNF